MENEGDRLKQRIDEASNVLTLLIAITGRGGLSDLEQALAKLDVEELRLALAGAVGVICGNYLEYQQREQAVAEEWERTYGGDMPFN